jgi:hypothetical protein
VRVETALRALADHLGGDPASAEISHLMRLPGSTNYKREAPAAVRVIRDRRAARYELDEIEDWLKEAARPLLARNKTVKANGAAVPYAAFTSGVHVPINVDARLAAMRFEGNGDTAIHPTQLSVCASLLRRGADVASVIEKVLAATKKAAGPVDWDWAREERGIARMCTAWLKKHPPKPAVADKPGKEIPREVRFCDQVLAEIANHKLPHSAFAVAYVIGQLSRTGVAWPSQNTIAARVGLHPDTVRDLIRQLAERGCLQVTVRRGRGRTSHYKPIVKGGPHAPFSKP